MYLLEVSRELIREGINHTISSNSIIIEAESRRIKKDLWDKFIFYISKKAFKREYAKGNYIILKNLEGSVEEYKKDFLKANNNKPKNKLEQIWNEFISKVQGKKIPDWFEDKKEWEKGKTKNLMGSVAKYKKIFIS